MWTPFAVRVALKRWKDSRRLGNTLGDLLDAIVSARAERDLEIPSEDSSSDLPKTSVLALASAMAFEMLIVDGQAACSADAIGSTLKRAKCLCSNVYGADGLNSSQFTGLLQKHDLVQLTSDESFRWNHQLVAGALAARRLASQWRQHLRALEQPLADDVWVFATRHIPQSDLDEYLGELFQADLMLGARATEELPAGERDRSLHHIFKALQPEQPEELQVTAFFALARVGTKRALSFLRKTAEDRRSENGFHAARALAYSGDRLFLLELATEVDRNRQMGWIMSGGDIAVWESASLVDRIAIARERLSLVVPGETVNESLSLLGYEASQKDIPLLEIHLHASKDLTAWVTALRAIKRGDHDRAQCLLEETLSQVKDSATKSAIMTAGHSLGLSVNVDEAFSLLIDLSSESEDVNDMVTRNDLIEKVLGELPLTMSIRCSVEDQLPTSTGAKKSSLWQLATRIESPMLALVALDMFVNDLENVGLAANYFLAHQTLRDKHHDALQAAIDRYLTNKTNWFTFNSWRVLALAAELEFTTTAAKLLQRMILRLAELRELVNGGTMPTFDKSEEHVARNFKIDSARFRLQDYASYLVTGAVGAHRLLPSSVLLEFLHFGLASSTPGKEIVNVYRDMDPILLDNELEKVRDKWAQRASLEMVCELGLTDRRLELLRTHLRETYCHPMGLGFVKRALERCWNSRTCAMVVETITDFEDWPEVWQQFFSDFIRMVGARVTSADRSLIERHLVLAKTAFAQRVLRVWRQATLDSRVGLSRLET